MKRYIPVLLTTFRLLLGPVVIACAWTGAPRILYLPILMAGMLSDIFDGVLARRFGLSTPELRRYDSITDVVYYLFLFVAIWKVSRPALVEAKWAIALIALSEAACIAVSLIRFAQYPATHTYLARFYALATVSTLVALLVFNAHAGVVFVLTSIALLANAEIVAIHLVAEAPPIDIDSFFHVRLARQPH